MQINAIESDHISLLQMVNAEAVMVNRQKLIAGRAH